LLLFILFVLNQHLERGFHDRKWNWNFLCGTDSAEQGGEVGL